MAAPTFVAEYETVWNTTTTPKTVSVTTAVGDVLVCYGIVEDGRGDLSTPTGGTGAWSLLDSINIDDYCGLYLWTKTATVAETFTLSMARTGSAVWYGLNVSRYSGSAGIGAVTKTNVSSGAPSLGINTTAADSALGVAGGDWNAVDGTSRTWRSVNGSAATELAYFRDASHYTLYVGRHPNAGAAGAKTVGLSAPSGQKYSIIAVEVLGTSSGPQTVNPTGIASGQATGTPAVSTSVTVSPTGITSGQAVGAPSVSTSTTVAPAGIASGAALGTPAVATSVTVSPTGIPSGQGVGTPVAQPSITVAPGGVASGQALGTPTVSTAVTVAPTGIPTGAAVGTPSIVAPQTVAPAGIASGAALGTPVVSASITVAPGGINTGAMPGTPGVTTTVTVAPTGIASATAVGAPTVSQPAPFNADRNLPVKLAITAPVVKLDVEAPQWKVDVEAPAPVGLDVSAPDPIGLTVEAPDPIKLEVSAPVYRLEITT